MSGEEIVVATQLPVAEEWKVGSQSGHCQDYYGRNDILYSGIYNYGAYMEKLGHLQEQMFRPKCFPERN